MKPPKSFPFLFVGLLLLSGVICRSQTPAPVLSAPIRLTGGSFKFDITARSGQQIAIHASTNLANWISLATNTVPGSGGASWTFSFTDSQGNSFNQRYYRAVVLP